MHDQPTSRPRRDAARTISRGYAVTNTLRALERLAVRSHSTTELADSLGVDARSARGLLQRLAAEGYAVQEGGHRRRYHLTVRLLALAATVEDHAPALAEARRQLLALAEASGSTVRVWALRGSSVVCVWGPFGLAPETDGPSAAARSAGSVLLPVDEPPRPPGRQRCASDDSRGRGHA